MSDTPAVSAPTDSGTLRNHGQGAELLGIFLINIVLTVLTLGIYRFWGKTRTRRYLIGHVEMGGERFAYSGTGGELFLGFLRALVIVIPFVLLMGFTLFFTQKVFGRGSIVPTLVTLAFYLVFIPLAFVAAYSGRRYRLSRISWRGIRFGQAGTALEYAVIALKTTLLTIVTLGIYHPYAQIERHKYVIGNTQFGDRRFTFDGDGKDLISTWVICLLLAIPTLTLSLYWYMAAEERYVFGHTRCGTLSMSFDITGGAFLWLVFGNLLLVVFTLGLGFPWMLLRSVSFLCDRLTLHGISDLATLKQNAQPLQKTGEGLLDLLDADIAT